MNDNCPVAANPPQGEDLQDRPQGLRRWLPHLPRRKTLLRRLRSIALRCLGLAGGFLFFLLLLTGSAAWYTSRPEFCRSCHIMEPYFKSWQASAHKDVPCVKCHFPPGVAEKARGKMLGLVQLAKYVTRSEGPRPAAEIPDASCLRLGCHETRLLSGKVDFHGIPFDHEPHLTKLRRGKKLRCTSCHSLIVQGKHMSVTTTTCFLCHFKGGLFNEGPGACTRCHQIPKEEFNLGGGATFNHELAYEKGIDCSNCHGDLVRGDGAVPHERCQVCHNRTEDLKQIGNVEFIHKNHITDHKIDCLDCHLEIEHSLDKQKLVHSVSHCTACHPDHHSEQVKMFQGIGSKAVPAHSGSMVGTRIDCRSCHSTKKVSATGTVLWKASAEICLMCHDATAVEAARSYNEKLEKSRSDLESTVERLREALKSAELDEGREAAVERELEDIQHDLDFLRVGNGIHNIHYASTLARVLVDHVTTLCREFQIDEPKVMPPKELRLNGNSSNGRQPENSAKDS